MRYRLLALLLLLCLPLAAQNGKVFPYNYYIDDLPNGLRVITVPTDFPNLVAVYTVVQTGSRNEVEPGKSGFAHLFEHLMFRGSKNFTPEQRDEILKRAGASTNAYTTDDRTVYHLVFSKEDLDKTMELEADRFQWLQYDRDAYKTETGAVLGEYNKNSSNPSSKMYEVLRETAFKKHTYSHTTMGYLKDIQDMPNQYDYSIEFYRRYYRPEYAIMIVAGDVDHAKTIALVKKHFSGWQKGDYKAAIPKEPPQDGPRQAHVDWPSPTLPQVMVAFRSPAFSDTDKDTAALNLLADIAFGPNSDIHQRLVLKEQKAQSLYANQNDNIDPELFTIAARIKNAADLDYVRDQILAVCKQYSETLVPQEKLNATRARARYGFAMQMDSSEAIANVLAPFVNLQRTPETINRLFALAEQVTPEDIRAAARKYLVEQNRTIVTLKTKADVATGAGMGGQQ